MRTTPLTAPLLATDVSEKHLLLCFSHLRWNFVYQRPQHLLSRAVADQAVWFIEEPVFEEGDDLPLMRSIPQACGVIVMVPVLRRDASADEHVRQQRSLLDALLHRHRPDRIVTWYYTPMALKFSSHLEPDVCVYDCMDELSAFKYAPPELTVLEQRLFDRADVVFTGGQSLYEAKKRRHHNCHAAPSSVDIAHFARARSPAAIEPEDQRDISYPCIGYFGVIDERMDLDLVTKLAAMRPEWQFVFLGPVVKIDPASLPRAANIHWLGPKEYSTLPEYLSGWHCAFMPFAINEATRFISPTKTPEFLAAGVPVCSTPIRDVVTPYGVQGLVEIASDADEFSQKLDLLLKRRRSEWLARVDRFLDGISWDETWARMQGLIGEVIEGSSEEEYVDRASARASGRDLYV
jgi:hypothetical protein